MPKITVVRLCQRFVLVRSGKTHRHGNICHKGRIFALSQVPGNEMHFQGSPMVSQETEGVGKIQPRAIMIVSTKKVRRGRVSRFNIG